MLNTSNVIAMANTPSLKAIVRSKPLGLSPPAEATAMARRFALGGSNPATGSHLRWTRELAPSPRRRRSRAGRGGDDRGGPGRARGGPRRRRGGREMGGLRRRRPGPPRPHGGGAAG